MFVGRQENDTALSFSVAFERPERSPVFCQCFAYLFFPVRKRERQNPESMSTAVVITL